MGTKLPYRFKEASIYREMEISLSSIASLRLIQTVLYSLDVYKTVRQRLVYKFSLSCGIKLKSFCM